MLSCLTLAVAAQRHNVTTIEGVANDANVQNISGGLFFANLSRQTTQTLVPGDFVRVTGASPRLSSGQLSSTWSRKQWPTLSKMVCSPASSDGWIDFRLAHA